MNTRSVKQIITGIPATDGAGVKLTRIIGTDYLNMLDPFLLLDRFSSEDPDDYIAGFPEHPHRGFETVTYLLQGRMRHKDSAGHEGVVEAGGVQWMTAGKGVLHSEMPEQEDGMLAGFQLWLNLPSSHKLQPASYQEFDAANIPLEQGKDCLMHVIAGTTDAGTTGPISQPLTAPLYFDIEMHAGAMLSQALAETHNAFVYVESGAVEVAGSRLARGQLAVLSEGNNVVINASEDSRVLLLAGKPLGEPVARGGPFVMNTQEEIRQAVLDYQNGQLF